MFLFKTIQMILDLLEDILFVWICFYNQKCQHQQEIFKISDYFQLLHLVYQRKLLLLLNLKKMMVKFSFLLSFSFSYFLILKKKKENQIDSISINDLKQFDSIFKEIECFKEKMKELQIDQNVNHFQLVSLVLQSFHHQIENKNQNQQNPDDFLNDLKNLFSKTKQKTISQKLIDLKTFKIFNSMEEQSNIENQIKNLEIEIQNLQKTIENKNNQIHQIESGINKMLDIVEISKFLEEKTQKLKENITNQINQSISSSSSSLISDQKSTSFPRTSGKWIKGPSIPVKTAYFAYGEINGSIYLAGGWNNENGLFSFNPIKNEWTKPEDLPKLPKNIYQMGSCVVKDKLYCIGGDVL